MEEQLTHLFSNDTLILKIKEVENTFNFTKEEDIALKSFLVTSFLLTLDEQAPFFCFDLIVTKMLENRGKNCYDQVLFEMVDEIINESGTENQVFSMLENFIFNGYCFHSFNTGFYEKIHDNGLVTGAKPWEQELKQIQTIFKNKGIMDVFGLYKQNTPIFFANSLKSASFYAYSSPTWFRHFASGGMKKREGMDKNAYFNRDYEKAKKNVLHLCEIAKLSSQETDIVIAFFLKYWNQLATNELPMVALIPRKTFQTKEKVIVESTDEGVGEYIKRVMRIYGDQNHIVYHDIKPSDLLFFSYDFKKNKTLSLEKRK